MRRRELWLVAITAGFLLALWLALPRLLGYAVSHWVKIPGLEQISVSITEVDWDSAAIRQLSGRFRSDNGDVIEFDGASITLAFDFSRRHAHRIDIERAKLTITPTEKVNNKPWPAFVVPRLPLDQLQIRTLDLVLAMPDQRYSAAMLLSMKQSDDRRVVVELTHAQQQLALAASEQSDHVLITAHWREGERERAHATLRIGHQPATHPARFESHMDLDGLPELLATLLQPVQGSSEAKTAPLQASGGIDLTADIQLAELSGQWHQMDAALKLSSVQLQHPDGVFTITGPATMYATPGHVQLGLQPTLQWKFTSSDSSIGEWRSTTALPAQVKWRRDDNHQTLGQLQVVEILPITWHTPTWGTWQLAVSNVDLQLLAGSLPQGQAVLTLRGETDAMKVDNIAVQNFRAEGKLQLTSDTQISVSSAAPVHMQAAQLDITTKKNWRLQRPALQWQGRGQLAPINGSWKLNRFDGEFSGDALRAEQSDTSFQLGHWQAQLTLAEDHWRGSASAKKVQQRQADTTLSAELVQLHIKDYQLADGRGQFEVSAGHVQHSALPGWPTPTLQTDIQLTGELMKFAGVLQHQSLMLAQFNGQHRLDTEHGNGRLHWQHDLLALGNALQPRPRVLAPLSMLRGHDDGELQLQWRLNDVQQPLLATGNLQLKEGALQWDKASASGLAVTLQLNALHPLQGSMQLHMPHADLAAGIPVRDGKLELILDPHALQLEAFHASLLGAIWQTAEQQVPRAPSDMSVPLNVTGLDLTQVLALVAVDGLSGSGTLDGTLPVVYEVGGLAVRDGVLLSRAPGELKYAPATIVGDNIGLQALRDFRYQKMRVQLNYQPDGRYQIQLKLDGHNPTFYSGYPIAFTLNLNGQLPGLLRAALLSGDFNQHVLQQLQSGDLTDPDLN